MSRQTQNIVLGGLAALVAVVVLVAASLLLLTGDDGTQTAAVDPLAGTPSTGADQIGAGAGADAAGAGAGGTDASRQPLASPSSLPPRSTLAVALTPTSSSSTTLLTTTTSLLTTTTAAPTSSSTTSSSTTTTVAETTTTMADGSSTTAGDTSSSSTTMADGSTTSSSTPPSSESTTTTAAPAPVPGGLNALEQEIARLTNELRTNPNGPLKRQGPVPSCDLRVDRATGLYEPLAPVEISEVASLQVARPWSQQMSRNLQHRPDAGGQALRAVGIDARSYGENISFNNYPDKAMQHFTGWRESDGHFCNMMRPSWTHLGVGEDTRANGDSFATQNFYTL